MERDDVYEYSLDHVSTEEHGKKVRKHIWVVFWILLGITAAEVAVGVYKGDWGLSPLFVKFFFIGLTFVKAGYIVMSYMHLGDEKKGLRYVILAPYVLFILYLIFICLTEAVYQFGMITAW